MTECQQKLSKDAGLLGCDAVLLGDRYPTFRRIIAHGFSGSTSACLLDPESEGCVIICHAGSLSASDAVSHYL